MNPAPGLGRRFWRLAVPNVLSNLMVPLAGLIDLALLGHLDELSHLGGVALGLVVFDYVYWSFGFLRMGTTGLVAQAMGRGSWQEAFVVSLRGASVALSAGAILLLLRGPLGDLAFWILGAGADVEAAGRAYYDARIWAAPITLLNFVLLGWLLGAERSKSALIMSAVGHGTNIVLDLLFIGRFGWGAMGAGAATAWSQGAMLLCALWLTRDLLRGLSWSAGLAELRDLAAMRRLASLNTDILIRTVALVSVFGIFTNLAAMLGTLVLAAAALVRQVITLAAFFVDGFAFATESLAGHFAGAGRSQEMRRVLRMSIEWSLITSALFVLAFLVAPRPLFALLTDHSDVIELAGQLRWWLAPTLLFGAVAYALDGYFLGISAGRTLRAAMLWSLLAGFAPFAWFAGSRESIHLLFFALSLFMVARVITLGREIPRSLREI